jgi:O-antigen/teichoic acid export membrane protein
LIGFAGDLRRKFDGQAASNLASRFNLKRRSQWLKKGGLAVTDQALVSGSNFVLGVLLARSLPAKEYGAYALAFAVFLLLAGFHQNLILSPLSVLGPSLYSRRSRDYLGAVLYLQAGFGLVVMFGLIIAAAIFSGMHQPDMANALAGLAIAAPCILLFWLGRISQYTLEMSPSPAAKAAGLYCISLGVGLLLLKRTSRLSPFTVYLLMGAGSLIASCYLFGRLKPTLRQARRDLSIRPVCAEHWKLGRWEMSTGIVYTVGENIWIFLTALILGVVDVAGVRAMANLALPASHVIVALGRLAQPYASRIAGQDGDEATNTFVRKVWVLLSLGATVYFVAVLGFDKPIVRLLYGGKFLDYAYLAPLLTLGVVFQATSQAYNVGLRALQKPSSIFAVYAASTGLSLIVGIPVTYRFGLLGMLLIALAANLISAVVALTLFRGRVRASTAARVMLVGHES